MTNALKDSPSDVVRQLLVNLGQCVDPTFDGAGKYTGGAWPAFSGTEPPQPDDCVTIYRGTDVVDARTMRGNLMLHYAAQFRVRCDVSDDGKAKAQELQRAVAEDVLGALVTVGANNYKVLNFAKIGPVLELGYNVPTDKRFLYTVNMLAVIRPLN